MPSSVIRRFVYDETEEALWVEFTTGRRYVYSGVPKKVAEAFRGAFAKGVRLQHPHSRSLPPPQTHAGVETQS